MLSSQLLQELQQIIKEEYGQDLGMDEVSQIGNGLVGYFDLQITIIIQLNRESNNKKSFLGWLADAALVILTLVAIDYSIMYKNIIWLKNALLFIFK